MFSRVFVLSFSSFFCVAASSVTALAEQIAVEKCNATLVQSTYTSNQGRFRDWRLAQHVSQSTYEEIKKGAGVNAVIYGIPMGASWNDFQKNISSERQDRQESLTESEFQNIAWTGLDANNVAAYTACVNGLVQSTQGINLAIIRSTESEITARIYYSPKGAQSTTVPIIWSGSGRAYATDDLPKVAVSGQRDLIFKRPDSGSATLGVFSADAGDSSSVVLLALPPVPPAPPPDNLATACAITDNATVTSLSNGQSATWECPALKAGKYKVSFSVGGSTPQGMSRVNYSVRLEPTAGPATSLSTQGVADFNVPPKPGLYPSIFQTNDQNVDLPKGIVQVRLALGGVYSHLNFANGNFGSVQIPHNVSIHLKLLE